ncbi:uncharacterized protein LOC105870818 [Microcebus murinus]|uniref:uncharacterized protein LOC105870818 n=1 Tax=Microcebus murinus TaxID=30608 RepID=UPI003F6AADA2
MNCSWAPGPAAPADVRYRLYSWDSADAEEKECVHYLTDSMGTRVGCHFDRLGEPKRTDNYFFLLNGTSKDGAVQFVDFTPFVAVNMGTITSRHAVLPPGGLSGFTALWFVPGGGPRGCQVRGRPERVSIQGRGMYPGQAGREARSLPWRGKTDRCKAHTLPRNAGNGEGIKTLLYTVRCRSRHLQIKPTEGGSREEKHTRFILILAVFMRGGGLD